MPRQELVRICPLCSYLMCKCCSTPPVRVKEEAIRHLVITGHSITFFFSPPYTHSFSSLFGVCSGGVQAAKICSRSHLITPQFKRLAGLNSHLNPAVRFISSADMVRFLKANKEQLLHLLAQPLTPNPLLKQEEFIFYIGLMFIWTTTLQKNIFQYRLPLSLQNMHA